MKKCFVSILCFLLAGSVVFNICGIVKFNSYKEKKIHSLMTQIYIYADSVKENVQYVIDEEDYTLDSMRIISSHLGTLAALFKSNRDIYYYAEDDFRFIAVTFLTANNYTPPCDIEGLFKDGTILENEVEYMKEIITIVDKLLLDIYDEETDTFNLDELNTNLREINKILHDYEKSPYLLIKAR